MPAGLGRGGTGLPGFGRGSGVCRVTFRHPRDSAGAMPSGQSMIGTILLCCRCGIGESRDCRRVETGNRPRLCPRRTDKRGDPNVAPFVSWPKLAIGGMPSGAAPRPYASGLSETDAKYRPHQFRLWPRIGNDPLRLTGIIRD